MLEILIALVIFAIWSTFSIVYYNRYRRYHVDNKIKYVGRCTDNFKKRINQGYGKIHAKNCFIDGQATNCRVNSLLNSSDNVQLEVYVMTDKTTEEIKKLEKLILKFDTYEWNIQTS